MSFIKIFGFLCLFSSLYCDVFSVQNSIIFDHSMGDGEKEMVLTNKNLGIGTLNPQKRLHVSGNALFDSSLFLTGINNISDNTTLGNESIALVDSSLGNLILTLPSPALYEGRMIVFKKVVSENDVQLVCPTGKFNQGGNLIQLTSNSNLPSFWLCSTGSSWVTLMESVQITATAPVVTIINYGSTWSYLDTGTNLDAVSWKDVSYDDSAWSSGNAILGYGTINAGSISTTLSYGADSGNKYPTTYFRQEFTLQNSGNYQYLDISLLADDGAVIYLNGEEIHRYKIATGSVSYSDYATGTGDESNYLETTGISTSAFQDGVNVISVELHQANASSSDIGLDLKIEAY